MPFIVQRFYTWNKVTSFFVAGAPDCLLERLEGPVNCSHVPSEWQIAWIEACQACCKRSSEPAGVWIARRCVDISFLDKR
ncbi:Coproporphyrin III ferrochelatase [Frankliniella fusca]|uniref:Coproporphyrin III ferrochelatase n=1 Tax=Frankliniella fusca TaxID=407009 RepID=A0AAE1I1R2_9NEOP|nr:Coproporphyrin III ferrochelatase [Frankliniella fusca]KAK3931937.1 Coproporphyrin III ferrochelatase [Frankliniella fusca]